MLHTVFESKRERKTKLICTTGPRKSAYQSRGSSRVSTAGDPAGKVSQCERLDSVYAADGQIRESEIGEGGSDD